MPRALQLVPTTDKLNSSLTARIVPGRLVELSGVGASARTTTAVSIVRAVQGEGDTAAWIQFRGGGLYPPDLHASGIDLDALIVVHVPRSAAAHASLRAAELLLRSSAFGVVVIDLDEHTPCGPSAAWQGRLLGLARQHQSRVVFLTRRPDTSTSLGPLIGLRFSPQRRRTGPGAFEISPRLLKNKSGAPFEIEAECHRGPWGLR